MGEAPLPSVRLGKVEALQMDNYRLATVDGIDVYYQDDVSTFYKELTVKIEKILFMKWLVAT